ncbi:MAG: phage tail tip lysozyme, partial [Flavobacteriaceae bacterium]
ARYDTPAIGRGIANLGEGLGSAANSVARNEKRQEEVPQAERFETQRRFLEFSAQQDDELAKAGQSAQPGAFGFKEGFTETYQKRAKEFLASVPEQLKPEYDARLFQVEDSLAGRAQTFERKERGNYYNTKVNDGLTLIEDKLYRNPASFDENLKTGMEYIDSLPDEDVGPIEKEALRRSWRAKAQFASLGGLPPAVRMEALGVPRFAATPLPADVQGRAQIARDHFVGLGYTPEQAAGIVGNLVQESGVRSDGAVGDNGTAFGIAQWRGERFTRLKRFAASRNTDWTDFTTQLDFIDSEMKTHETKAYEKLKAAGSIEEATAAFIGYERPRGYSDANPSGGHGWGNRLAAAQRVAGVTVNVPRGEVDPRYADMSWQDRAKIADAAETEAKQQAKEERVTAQFAIENALTNAPAAIQNTGEYSGSMPTQAQFMAAYGEDAVRKFKEFQQVIETSREAFRMQTMPEGEIASLVASAEPTSSGDDAALQQARYDTLSKAAQNVLKARDSDPATYVRRAFGTVNRAWSGATTPEGYQAAITASVAAQQQLGIRDVKPLPKEMAVQAAEAFNDAEKPQQARIDAIAQVMLATPDPAQRRAIFQQLVDAGMPAITEGAFEALARGDSGAARRLFQAAMTDPSKLPGTAPEKPEAVSRAIQDSIMADGAIGDIYYGLSDGSVENFDRAERDAKLIKNAVEIRLRNGEDLDAAVEAVAKDLYGDVQPVTRSYPVNAEILLPKDADVAEVMRGFEAVMPKVRSALEAIADREISAANPSTSDGQRAILEAVSQNRIENILSEGYFRNRGDGFVFIDPRTGNAVKTDAEERLFFSLDDLGAAALRKRGTDLLRQQMRPGVSLLPPPMSGSVIPDGR